MKKSFRLGLLIVLLAACQPATPPPPITANLNAEFTLAIGQTATLNGADLEITLGGVSSDGRCPLEIECAASLPVNLTLSVRSGSEAAQEFEMQTFTDNDGAVPPMHFGGMRESLEFGGYLIQIVRILPFPRMSMAEIGDEEYRVSFTITR